MVQIVIFFLAVASVVLVACAFVGEMGRLREEYRQTSARVASLENELLRLRVPKVAGDSKTFENLQQPHRNPVTTTRGAGRATCGRGDGDGRIHYEIGREGARERGPR